MFDVNLPFAFSVNDSIDLKITPAEAAKLDKIKLGENLYHVLQNNKAYRAEVVKVDYFNKIFHIEINHNLYVVSVDDKFDRLVKRMGLTDALSHKITIIKAPMPGLVLEVIAQEGQEVKKGDNLLILEAMKMENIIKSVENGIIKSIKVQKGTPVEKGQVLIELE